MRTLIKALVAIALIALLIKGVDWRDAKSLIAATTWWTFAAVLAAMMLEMALSAWKWLWSLRMHGLNFATGYLLRTIAIGFFFNNFLPTSIGGDAYRVYRTLPQEGYRSRALSAVAVERIIGLGALLTLGCVGAFMLLNQFLIAQLYLLAMIGGGIGALLVLYALYRGWLKWLTNRIRHLKVFDAVEHNIGRLMNARREWVNLLALSFIFQAVSISIVYWLFQQVGHPVSFSHCALVTAAAGIAAVLPLSINGIGLMEGSFVGMAVALGIGYDPAVLVAIARRLMLVVLSILCALVYLLEKKAPIPTST